MPGGRVARPPVERFMEAFVACPVTGCWLWRRAINPDNGYGRFTQEKRQGIMAHKWAYIYFKGEYPKGYHIDHLCRVRHCVNPEHLEAVTPVENVRRSRRYRPDACPHGHKFTPENTHVRPETTHRHCRTCGRIAAATKRQRQRDGDEL